MNVWGASGPSVFIVFYLGTALPTPKDLNVKTNELVEETSGKKKQAEHDMSIEDSCRLYEFIAQIIRRVW